MTDPTRQVIRRILSEQEEEEDWQPESDQDVIDAARAEGIDLTVELIKEDPGQVLTYELHQDPDKIEALRQVADIPPIWIACGKLLDGHHRLLSRAGARFIWAYEVNCDTYEWLTDREFADIDVVEFLTKVNA